eukprot:12152754-Prorocentrum_lima.AAC.1
MLCLRHQRRELKCQCQCDQSPLKVRMCWMSMAGRCPSQPHPRPSEQHARQHLSEGTKPPL